MATTLTLELMYRPVRAQLHKVREAVADVWVDTLRLVHESPVPRPNLGGKMLRPALCLLSAGVAGARDLDRFVPLAAAMELLHLAALVHDDVIDGSDMRRGGRSLKAQWDDHAAVLGGDYLVARAIAIMGSYNICDMMLSTIDSVRQMAEGELTDFGRGSSYFSQEECVGLAKQKTASLFAATCSAPTYLINLNCRESLYRYGLAFGVAFQVTDDVLDLSQDEETLGKPACRDIVAGKKTLPILFLREAMDEEGRGRLDNMKGATLTEADREWVAEALERTGTRVRSEAVAREYVDEAQAALDGLPANPYRDSMVGLAEFVLVRGS